MSNNSIYDHMLAIIKEPNNKTKSELKEALLLVKFYNNPESVLGDKNTPTPEKYEKIVNYITLFLSNNFTLLIEEGIKEDEHFRNKLTVQLLRKISFFLFDGIECKKNYIPNVRQKFKEAVIAVNRAAKDKSIDNNAYREYFGNAYCLHRKLKYGKYSQKKVDKFDDVLAERVRTRVNDLLDIVYKETEGRQREKEFYLSVIKKENYVNDDYEDNFLETYTVDFGFGFNENFIISVVLENRFLDIIDNCIQNNNVNLIMIKNTIKVIEFGIRIRAHQFYDYESYIVELFDKELIRNYDVERAERIISQLSILQLKLEKAEPLLKLVKK